MRELESLKFQAMSQNEPAELRSTQGNFRDFNKTSNLKRRDTYLRKSRKMSSTYKALGSIWRTEGNEDRKRKSKSLWVSIKALSDANDVIFWQVSIYMLCTIQHYLSHSLEVTIKSVTCWRSQNSWLNFPNQSLNYYLT